MCVDHFLDQQETSQHFSLNLQCRDGDCKGAKIEETLDMELAIFRQRVQQIY